MTKLVAFFMALNCFDHGWIWTGVILLYICFFKTFKD